MSARLECVGLTGGWGSLTAFREVDLAVGAGTIHAILGPNGAGKTTLLLTLAGLLPAQQGTVAVDGLLLRSGRATAAGKAGVVLVADNRRLFPPPPRRREPGGLPRAATAPNHDRCPRCSPRSSRGGSSVPAHCRGASNRCLR